MASGWRSIVLDTGFEEQLAALIRWEPWRDDYLAGAQALLAVDPSAGLHVITGKSGEEIWKLPLPPVDNRTVTLFYTFDAQDVTFLFLDVEDLP